MVPLPPLSAALLATTLLGLASAQERGPTIASALARGDRATAEATAAAEPDPARRALFEAALQPLPQRPGAFLSVAQRFPRDDAAGDALLAGCATALLVQGRWPTELGPLPDCAEAFGDAWYAVQRDPRSDDHLAVVLPALLQAVHRWEGERPEAARLPLLRRLARLCACQVVQHDPLPIASDEAWPLPQPLGEDLLITVRRIGDTTTTPLELVDALQRDGARRWLVSAREALAELPSPGDGRWLVEVQSVAWPWRALRVVDVGSLRATVLVDEGILVFAADEDLRSDDDTITWTGRFTGPQPATTGRGGLGLWPLPAGTSGAGHVQARRGDACARVPVWLPSPDTTPREALVAHWQCDRPLHRPGETVQGRVVVRSVAWQGSGLAAVPTTAVAVGARVPFVCTWPDGTKLEQRVDLDARGVASFTATVPPTSPPGRVRTQLGPLPDGAIVRGELTTVAAFRRPAVVGHVRGPLQVTAADGFTTVQVQARWASGGPAALPVEVSVGRVGAWRYEHRRLATGADGRLDVPIDVHDQGGEQIACRCELQGPDGHVETLEHTIVVLAPGTPTTPAPALTIAGDGIVGQALAVTLRGRAYDDLVVVLGRGSLARAIPVTLSRDGTREVSVDVLASDWPRLDVAAVVAGTSTCHRTSVPVRHRAATPLRLDVPDVARPGESVRCTATATAGDLVTFAVADDRMFRLRADPTRAPDDALRPDVPQPRWRVARNAECVDPRLVFGGLLVDGRVPGPGGRRDAVPSAGGAGGPAAGSAAEGALRSDFRATACFRTVVADAQGRAVLEFTLPDDITTWRVTATSVDAVGEGALTHATFATRLPLAAELQLPRMLRIGDRVDVPLLLDRAADAAGDDTVHFTIAAAGAVRSDGDATGAGALARGTTHRGNVALVAQQVGDGIVRSEATLAPHVDRSERHLPVLDDTVAVAITAAAAGRGTIAVTVPAARSDGAPVQVDVLAGGAAAWQRLAQRLQEYPYGCVEQTLSRLVPFAAANAAPGDPGTRADRIGKGMARLRQLQHAPGGAFAWWPGDTVDLAMTGLVLHGLAALRAGGIAPADYGIRIEVEALLAQAPPTSASAAAAMATAELRSGLLRFAPHDEAARAAAAASVDEGTPLPRGTALRLGLALAAAGDQARAARCRQGLPLATGTATGFPGSDPTVHRAHELELDRALGVAIDAAREMALVQELLGAPCRTYTDAVALVALAPGLAASPADVTATLTVDDGTAVPLVLAEATHRRATQHVSVGRRVVVQCADANQLLFVQVATATTRPGRGPGWAEPFVVTRRLSGPGVVATGDEPIVRAGERVRIELQLTTPVAARYVALVCPLPAGWELLGDAPGLQAFDDRVAIAWPLATADGAQTVAFDVVPTLAGVVAWPAVTASAMYEAALGGGSSGGRVRVVPPEPATTPPAAAPFLARAAPPRPESPKSVPTPAPSRDELLAAAAATITELWFADVLPGGIYGFDEGPDASQQAALAAALALFEQHAAADARVVARHVPADSAMWRTPRGGALAPWRRALRERLALLHERCLDAVAADCERNVARGDARDGLAPALRSLPAARAEVLATRLLAALWPTDADHSAAIVEALPTTVHDARLVDQLVAMLASGNSDVVAAVLPRVPEARLLDLAPSVLAALVPHADDRQVAVVVRTLARTPAGRRTLHTLLAEAERAEGLDPDAWPDEACTGLPAASFALLAAHAPERARALLAGGAVPVATLWQWLLARGDGVPLDVVAGALDDLAAPLPADVLAARIADPTVAALRSALAARREPTRFGTALADARPLLAAADDTEPILAALVGDLCAIHGDVHQVTTFARWLTAAGWRTVWRRLPATATPPLLQLEDTLGYGLPATDDVLVSLLQHAATHDALDDAVLALGAETTGLERVCGVRQHLQPALRAAVDAALCDRLGYDAVTGNATNDAASCVRPFAAANGWHGVWPAPLRAARDELLTLLGLH